MKWYSVETHTPLIGGEYFVTDSSFCYVAEYSAEGKWMDTSGEDDSIYKVTHFCKPDSVPKD